jgi:hypothetical protein
MKITLTTIFFFMTLSIFCQNRPFNFQVKVYSVAYNADSTQNDTIPVSNAKITICNRDSIIIEGPFYTDTFGKLDTLVFTYGTFYKVEKDSYYPATAYVSTWRPETDLIWEVILVKKTKQIKH